jgi:predicted glycoside hydrolase/deacetylase ChbG (UPF0249 family)
MSLSPRSIILCADDYGMTAGISEGILSLAATGRLSATSAMVTTHHWPAAAARLRALRPRLAVGLHFNLTTGQPLGPMPRLAPGGSFPSLSDMLGKALTGRLNRAEIADELGRQLDRFTAELGAPPDFVDGHHHVHVLPVVRRALVDTLAERHRVSRPLLRDPSDSPAHILRRPSAGKALLAAALATGFAELAAGKGFAVNRGFSGFSTFGRVPFAREVDAFLLALGPRHMIMCHPGFPDAELAALDRVAERRREEYEVLASRPDLPDRIWRPERGLAGSPVVWPSQAAA